MAITNCHTVNGELIGETTSSIRTGYLTDGLGSVTATQGTTGNVLATYRYKPYGTLLAKTGAGADPRFLWVGAFGYRASQLSGASIYVRARHLAPERSGWVSLDSLWPTESAFAYCRANPVLLIDPTGSKAGLSWEITKKHMACGKFHVLWTFHDLLGRKEIFFLQHITKTTGKVHDCSSKRDYPSDSTTSLEVWILPTMGGKLYGKDTFACMSDPVPPNTFACTRGSRSISASFSALQRKDQPIAKWGYPPPMPPWAGLGSVYSGWTPQGAFILNPYKDSWRGTDKRSVKIEWDCCLEPSWLRLTASAPGWKKDQVWEEPRTKPTKKRKCPDVRGVGGE